MNFTTADIAGAVTAFAALVAIAISISTLNQNQRMIEEGNRAYIVFFVTKPRSIPLASLVIKNFGKSSGILRSIHLDPPLNYEKSSMDTPWVSITECKDIFLAPSQSIRSLFSFENYPDTSFQVMIEYETLGKRYTECYSVSVDHHESYLETNPDIKDTCQGLKAINSSIREVSEKLL